VGYFDVNQKNGWRLSTYAAYLKPVLQRNNLHIWSETLVDKLIFTEKNDNKSSSDSESIVCDGIKVRHKGTEKILYARKEVILTAGAIGSVQVITK
jgi:choline dehydrogenase